MILSRMLEALPEAICAFDPRLQCIYANRAGAALALTDDDLEAMREVLRTGATIHRERRSGTVGHAQIQEYRFVPLRDDEGNIDAIAVAVSDVTDRKIAEIRIAQLQSIAMKLSASVSFEEIGELVITHIQQDLGSAAAVVYLLSDGVMRLVAWNGLSPSTAEARATLSPDDPLPLARAILTGEPQWIERREELLSRYPSIARSPVPAYLSQSVAALPATFERRTLGGIGLSFSTERTFDQATREFLVAVATLAAQAAERARLFEVEARARTRLSVLAEASRLFSARLDLREVLGTVCEEVVRRIPESCAINLVTPEGALELVGLRHLDPAAEGSVRAVLAARPMRVGDASTPGQVAQSGRGLLVPQVSEQGLMASLPEYREHLQRFPLRSLIVVPLRAGDRVIGTLTAGRGPGHPPFDPGDFDLLQELADRAVLSIENARLYEAANAARARSDAASRAKDEFLALLGHELRNPLAPILGWLRMLRASPGESDHTLEIIERHARHMVRLVDDLLDISRITSQRLQLRLQPVELGEIVARAVELVRPLLEQRQVTLTTDVPVCLWVNGDPTRLEQVFANLLTNAAKYGRQGGFISVVALEQDERIRVSVVDDGSGIAPEDLPVIFDLFSQGRPRAQGSSSAAGPGSALGGLGLGLTIVRSFVEMHGGTVRAHSSGRGLGSTFVVDLPALPDPEAEDSETTTPDLGAEPASLRILVVDDNRDAADALGALLRFDGHQVQTAYDGAQALTAAADFAPEVALLDLSLPDMHGHELGEKLRQLPGLDGLQLIAVTGFGQPEDQARSQRAGFAGHLVKPVDPDHLGVLLGKLRVQ